ADGRRMAVEGGNAAEVGHAGFSSDFLEENVQLVQRFDVFGNEADRNDENIRDALLAQPSDHIAGEWFEPFHGSDLTLKRELVRIFAVELIPDQLDRFLCLLGLQVAFGVVARRDRWGAER